LPSLRGSHSSLDESHVPFYLLKFYFNISGVSGLSLTEIKDDLRELHPPSDDNDTDSDSSILSDDILDSVYPVQPRSAPRSALQLQDQFSSGNNVSVDEAMYLIRDISKSHKELFEKEKLREEWEIRCEVSVYLRIFVGAVCGK
jgi:hypothetical protein